MKLVVIESPLSGDWKRNTRYARLCMLDCLRRGEAPYASHLLYTQCLDDRDAADRELGMAAGFAWAEAAKVRAVYVDLGVSVGMKTGIELGRQLGQEIEERTLPSGLMAKLDDDSQLSATPEASS